MVTRLYLVRHCQSAGNKAQAFQGRTDSDISEMGAEQLELLALRFRNIPIDAVYASPLMRARKTGEAVAKYHKDLAVKRLDDLIEIDVGDLEGMPFQALIDCYPDVAEAWDHAPWACAFPGGESMEAVYNRAKNAVEHVLSENAGQSVVLASHGCLLRNAICCLVKGDIQCLNDIPIVGNTSVTELEIDENGAVTVVRMNDMTHLPDGMHSRPGQYRLLKNEVRG